MANAICHGGEASPTNSFPIIMAAVGENPDGWADGLPGRSLFDIGPEAYDAERTVFS